MPRDPRLWDLSKGASKLHEHREEVIKFFRDGVALWKIGEKFGMRASGVQRWLRTIGEYDRKVTCRLPECGKEFPFKPGQYYCSNLHVRRANARDRRGKDVNKNLARTAVTKAIKNGALIRPEKCERCNNIPGRGIDDRTLIYADHHFGYEKENYLNVWWICSSCDHKIEKLRRDGHNVNKSNPLVEAD